MIPTGRSLQVERQPLQLLHTVLVMFVFCALLYCRFHTRGVGGG